MLDSVEAARSRRATSLGDGRLALELPRRRSPEQLIADLVGRRRALVSLNPLRDTLEDFFVEQVRASGRRRVLGEKAAS